MIRLLTVGGAVIALLGVVLIPLPGPGYLLVTGGAIALMAGTILRMTQSRGRDGL